MQSGTYWQYFCPKCGFFPLILIKSKDGKQEKLELKRLVKKHNLKYHK